MSREIDYWHNDKPKCPYCTAGFEVWDGDNALSISYEDGGRSELNCEHCGKSFVCETAIRYSFSTAVSDEAADDEAWGPQESEAA